MEKRIKMMNLSGRKKIGNSICLMLCLMLLIFSAGCGKIQEEGSFIEDDTDTAESSLSDENSDLPLVRFMCATSGNTQNLEAVTDAINEILAERYGIQCEITMESFTNYSNILNLALANPGTVDVFYISGGPASYEANGLLYDLTGFWSSASEEMKSLFDDEYIAANMVGGRLYAIPSNINFSNEILVHANREIMDEMGVEVDDSKIWTMEEIHRLIIRAMGLHTDIYGVAPQLDGAVIRQLNWDSLGDDYNIGVVENRGKTREVVSITECREFLEFAGTMREWYQEGLIMPDVMTTNETWSTLVAKGKAFCAFDAGCYPDGSETDDLPYYNLTLYTNWSAANCAVRAGFAIDANTENPQAAWILLQAFYCDQDLCNLLSWGIEGENYVVNEDGKAAYPDSVNLTNDTWTVGFVSNWALPNEMNAILPYFYTDDRYELMKQCDAAAEKSGCMGIVFDPSDVSEEYSACQDVYNEFYKAILDGVLDTDTAVRKFREELKAAGEDAVIAEKQAQIDAVYP